MKITITIMLALLLLSITAQEGNQPSPKKEASWIDSVAFTLLGGPHDAPIFTRLMNKLGQVGVVLGGAIFGYFKLFRKKKERKERINSHLSEELVSLVSKVDGQGDEMSKKAELLVHELAVNSEGARRSMGIHSANNQVNFAIQIEVTDVVEDSPFIYSLIMKGTDPQGSSEFTGYAAFVRYGLELRLEQTYPN